MGRVKLVNMGLGWIAFQVAVVMRLALWDCGAAASELMVTRVVATPTPVEVMIDLTEDEIIIPPLLSEFLGGPVLNSIRDEDHSRSVKSGELLEYGDRFRLLPRLALQVWSRERALWVGGGVFQGALFGPKIRRSEVPYGLRLDRGWVRIWVDEKPETPVRVVTPQGFFLAHRAEFWVLVHHAETEIYVISGALTGPGGARYGSAEEKAEDGQYRYYRWKSSELQPSVSSDWTPSQLEDKMKAVYPELLKLVRKAEDDWKAARGEKIFSELRKAGWRRKTRFDSKK
jgi:hypothetical protein